MRPDKQATDLEFWLQSAAHWKERFEYWMLESVHATGDWLATVEVQMDKCRNRIFAAECAHQEAQGLITVYTGRAKPRWS